MILGAIGDDFTGSSAGLDGCVTVVGLSATFAGRRCLPDHGGIEPDRQRAAALQRFVIGGPVPSPVGGGCGSAHAAQLPRWIHKMNSSWDLCMYGCPRWCKWFLNRLSV